MIVNARQIIESVGVRDVLTFFNVEVDRRGRACCPVHGGDNKNAFGVKNGVARCFTKCNKLWDAVELVKDLKDCTFTEAVEVLAQIGAIQVEYAKGQDRTEYVKKEQAEAKKREALSDQLDQLSQFYQQQIADYSTLFGERTFSRETLSLFEVGFAPAGKLGSDDYEDELLREAGIIKTGSGGDRLFFSNRIIFPVRDHNGRMAGFAGRKLPDAHDDIPKYLNSPESSAYQKSKLLYGLFQARESIENKGFVYVVEGYTDVIGLFDHEIRNVVASCGVAITLDHARILRRHTENVVLLFDGDPAGLEAAKNNIQPLLQAGHQVSVLLLPDDYDPDEYIRDVGTAKFKEYSDANKSDAILWLAEELHDKDDIQARERAIEQVGELISYIKKEIRREGYITDLKKIFGRGMTTQLRNVIKKKFAQRQPKKKADLTPSQQADILEYGIYEANHKYYETQSPDSPGAPISNFVIKPIMLIVGSDRSRRLVEVTNEFGHSFIKDIDSDDFVELSSFKKQVERRGNYIFHGKTEGYTRIKSKVYKQMRTAYPIYTLGQHKAGFFAWSNGIVSEGRFYPVDEFGLITYDDTRYFLPAFSKVYENIKSDDQDDTHEEEKLFRHVSKPGALSVGEWVHEMQVVFGVNGLMAAAFYFASLFRDLVFSRHRFFPHLNLFGAPGSGKSYLGWSLVSMFGVPRTPFHLAQGTNVGFFRKLSQTRNALVWFDEYSNDVDFKRIEALKAAYDGSGHEKGVKSNDNRTIKTSVNSASIISGQQQPVKDIALFKRCVSINFDSGEFTKEQHERGQALKDMEETGALSQITTYLQRYRQLVEKRFVYKFDEIRDVVQRAVRGRSIEDRIMANHVILAAVYEIIAEKEDLPVSPEVITEILTSNLVEQSKAISEEDEASQFWSLVQFLAMDRQIEDGKDFIIKKSATVKVKTGSKTEEITFDKPRRLIYLRLTRVHGKYMEWHKRQHNRSGLASAALKHYLRTSKAYVGYTKAKSFDDGTYGAWVFDANMLNLELPDSLDGTLGAIGESASIWDQRAEIHPSEKKVQSSTSDEEKLPF